LLLGQVGSCDLDWAWVWPGCRVVSRAGSEFVKAGEASVSLGG